MDNSGCVSYFLEVPKVNIKFSISSDRGKEKSGNLMTKEKNRDMLSYNVKGNLT